jgi:hypothetical protein
MGRLAGNAPVATERGYPAANPRGSIRPPTPRAGIRWPTHAPVRSTDWASLT